MCDDKPEIQLNELLKKEYNPKTYDCPYCERQFNSRSNKSRHLNTCKQHPSLVKEEMVPLSVVTDLQREIAKLKEQVENISHSNTTNNTVNGDVNNGTVNNISIEIKNFGSENMEALPHKLIRECFMNLDFREMMKNLYCDDDFPENHNVKIKSSKAQQLYMYKGDKWNILPYREGTKQIIARLGKVFDEFRRKHPGEAIEDMGEDEFECMSRELASILKGNKQNEIGNDILCALEEKRVVVT